MPRAKKDARVLNIKLNRQLYELLEKKTKETGKNKTQLVEEYLAEELLCEENTNKKKD